MKFVKCKLIIKGFSLTEMMVATALFSIIAITISSMILDMNKNNQLSISEKKIYDSLSIAMDDIAKRLREGANYTIDTNLIMFRPQSGGCEKYEFIESKIVKSSILIDCNNTNSSSIWTSIDFTPSDIYVESFITHLKSGDKSLESGAVNANMQQPYLQILISGRSQFNPEAKFKIETSVSQRSKF